MWQRNVQVEQVKAPAQPAKVVNVETQIADALWRAAPVYEQRADKGQQFAYGKAETCRDMARKLRQYGTFASDKQREFALKLVQWAGERVGDTPTSAQNAPQAPASGPKLPAPLRLDVRELARVMQAHATFYLPDGLELRRRNGDTLVWVVVGEACVGKIEGGVCELWRGRATKAGVDVEAVLARIGELERDPLGVAMKYGKLSGRCCSCGRDLTDPASIESGIGPICARKFQ